MTTRIRYLGVAGYEIIGPAGRIVIDPFLTGSPVAPIGAGDLETPDVILVSHAAFDHLGDTLAIARRTGAPVVCGADTQALLIEQGLPSEQVRATIWGIRVRVGSVEVAPVECHHWSMARLASGETVTGVPLGFVVETEPQVKIYHFGDSAIFSDMKLIGSLHRPTVGLIGCTQPWALVPPGAGKVTTGEMNPAEAALAAEMLGVRFAVATHYLETNDPAVTEFVDLVASQRDPPLVPIVLEPGHSLVIDGSQHRVEPS
ncbi:MAG: MBL fold metallo-hydrolase [Acidimicrobiia bacterium]